MEHKTVYIAGCWDFCHTGHLNILQKAKEFGDFLVVGVNSDDFIFSYKKQKMYYNEDVRLRHIMNLDFVDLAFILKDFDSQKKYIDIFKPSFIVHGGDWKGEALRNQMNISEEQISKYGTEFKYPDYTTGISSTMLRDQLK